VYISRLAYRKGVDLLIPIIPKILAQFDNVNFIIGGDGPSMNNLKGLIEKHNLHSRVELLGGLRPDKVRDVLCRGHIFLNTSLTESFCIAILEAACCGLLVVTTDVGGVPEVLPPHMAYLAKPEEKSIIRQLNKAVKDCKEKDIPTHTFNKELSEIYSWRQVAERTEKVYDYVLETPTPNILDRIKTAYTWGPLVGVYGIMYTIFEAITLMLTELMWPI
jgi:phosphatidylinositol glycan class A protein